VVAQKEARQKGIGIWDPKREARADFPLLFFDKDVFGSSGIVRYKSEFVRVTGTVTRYHNKYRKTSDLQIVVNLPGQVAGSKFAPDYSGGDTEGREEELELEAEKQMRQEKKKQAEKTQAEKQEKKLEETHAP
jgi:hypothetical protein